MKPLRMVRWYLTYAWRDFVCWYVGHDWLADPHAQVCLRCIKSEWL